MYRYNVNIISASLRGNIILIFFFLGLLPKVMGSSAHQDMELNSAILGDQEVTAGDEEIGANDDESYKADSKEIVPQMIIGLADGTKINSSIATISILNEELFFFSLPAEYKAKAVSLTYLGRLKFQFFSLDGCGANLKINLPAVEKINKLTLKNTGLKDISGYPELSSIAIFDIQNSPLVNISGLNQVTQILTLFLGNKPKLTDITGLQSLENIKYIGIKNRAHLDNIAIIRPSTPQLRILVGGYIRAIMPCFFVDAICKVIVAYAREFTPLAHLASNIGHITQEYWEEDNKVFILNPEGLFDERENIDIEDTIYYG